jgi:hypothetical protein
VVEVNKVGLHHFHETPSAEHKLNCKTSFQGGIGRFCSDVAMIYIQAMVARTLQTLVDKSWIPLRKLNLASIEDSNDSPLFTESLDKKA